MSIIKRTVLSMVGSRFMNSARIAEVVEVSGNFRFIELEAENFKTIPFKTGEKIQINVGDWNMRTYTPLSVNAESGRLGILAYLHGNGPGSEWARQLRSGDSCQLFGPHPSLKIPPSDGSLVLFGDETAIAVATGLKRKSRSRTSVKLIFEASSPEETGSIVQGLGLKDYEIYPKGDEGAISSKAADSVLSSVHPNSQVLLMGRAQSISQMRNYLKSVDFPMSQVIAKAYWSENRVGLD